MAQAIQTFSFPCDSHSAFMAFESLMSLFTSWWGIEVQAESAMQQPRSCKEHDHSNGETSDKQEYSTYSWHLSDADDVSTDIGTDPGDGQVCRVFPSGLHLGLVLSKVGEVMEVTEGVACGMGVQVGWHILTVGGDSFSCEALREALEGPRPFMVMFEVVVPDEDECRSPLDDYCIGKLLGEGGFGRVFSCFRKTTGIRS